MVSTSAWLGTERGPGTMMSRAAVTANHRTPSGTGAEASLDFSPGVVVVRLGGGMDAWVGFCGSGHARVVPCRRVVRAFPGPVGLSWSVGQVVES